MSSHHFVKEGQEPALLILDTPTFDVVGPLLEWAPLVVVAEQAIEDLLLWNIKMDVLLAEEQRVSQLTQELSHQGPIRILAHQRGESPLINALNLLIREKQASVNIVASDVETTIRLVDEFHDRIQVCLIDGRTKWSAIPGGLFEKWLSAGTSLNVRESVPLQPIEFTGLKTFGGYLKSELDGLIRIRSKQLFWVGEQLDPLP